MFSLEWSRIARLAAVCAVFTGGSLLSRPPASAGQRSRTPVAQVLRRGSSLQSPYNCGRISTLAVDYVNDAIAIPHAFSITQGEMPGGRLAAFRIFALGYDGAYFNITGDYVARSRPLTAHLLPVRGSGSVRGRFYYVEDTSGQTLYFRPARQYREDRQVLLVLRYRCSRTHVHVTSFTLTIRSTAAEKGAETAPVSEALSGS